MEMNPEPELSGKPKRGGSRSSYSKEVGDEICRLMSEGRGLRAVCELEGFPARTTVLRWLEEQPSFAERYRYAREALMDWYSEEILKIAFDDAGDVFIDGERVVSDHARVQRARLKVDTLKWIMSKLAPRTYGDHKPVDASAGITGELKITWDWNQPDSTPARQQPALLEWKPRELPADLADWPAVLAVLNNPDLAEEVIAVIVTALKRHVRKRGRREAKPTD
jgi:hypothetical protein